MMRRNAKAEEGAVIVYFLVIFCISSKILISHKKNRGYKHVKRSKNKSIQFILVFKMFEKRARKRYFFNKSQKQLFLPVHFLFVCKGLCTFLKSDYKYGYFWK
jgi:hypothetical protein